MRPDERLALLKSEELDLDIPPTSSPRIFRDLLHARPQVQLVKGELANGQLSEQTVRQFINDLMQLFVRGKRFEYETALAATAVVFEDYFSPYAEEFLTELAALRLSEIALATQVARLCLYERVTKSKCLTRNNPSDS